MRVEYSCAMDARLTSREQVGAGEAPRRPAEIARIFDGVSLRGAGGCEARPACMREKNNEERFWDLREEVDWTCECMECMESMEAMEHSCSARIHGKREAKAGKFGRNQCGREGHAERGAAQAPVTARGGQRQQHMTVR
jgi:hypothetical protein